jgi:hypothetical protein
LLVDIDAMAATGKFQRGANPDAAAP